MNVQNIKLSKEETQKVAQIEGSIQHWAIEYTQLNLKVRDLEGVLHSMYEARKQSLDAICKNAGINLETIVQANLVQHPNGDIVLTVHSNPTPAPKTEVTPEQGPNSKPTVIPEGNGPTSAS
jgi:hypothetical protein